MTLVSLPGAGPEHQAAELETIGVSFAQKPVVGICHRHLRERQVLNMESVSQNSMAQTVGSEQKNHDS